jgi:DNA polymerase III alpha subunit
MFGVKSIKSLTGVNGDKLEEAINNTSQTLGKAPKDFTWMEVLVYLSSAINSTSFKSLCSVGFFSSLGISRNRALYEYKIFSSLTQSETKWINAKFSEKNWKTLKECLIDLSPTKKMGGGTSSEDRSTVIKDEISFLDNPPYDLEDSPYWIVAQEKKLLGCPISISSIESSDTSSANTSCRDIFNGKTGKFLCVAANVKKMNTCKVKNGKSKGELMSFLTIEDESCVLDNVVVFPLVRKQYEHCLYEGNNLLFCGATSRDKPGFVVEKIYEI